MSVALVKSLSAELDARVIENKVNRDYYDLRIREDLDSAAPLLRPAIRRHERLNDKKGILRHVPSKHRDSPS